MPKNTQEVIVGVGTLYLAPENEPAPGDDANPGANWVNPGYTDEGLSLNYDKDIVEHFVEEETDPVLTLINRTDLRVMVSLAQDTLENIKYSYGGGQITTQAAALGVIGKKTYKFSTKYDVLALLVEGVNPSGFYRRIYIPRVMAVGTVETPYRRADGKRVYPCEFRAMADGTQKRQIVDKTANAL